MNFYPSYIGMGLFCAGLFLYTFLNNKKHLSIIIPIALIHRFYFFFISPVPSCYGVIKGHLLGDSFIYHSNAFFISEFPGFLTEHRPFYSTLVSVIYSLTNGRNYRIMIFFQHLMGVGIVFIVYKITRKLLNKEWAFISGLLSACLYYPIKVESALATEAAGLFFLVSAIYLLIIYSESSNNLFCVMAGLSLAYSNMMRPISIVAALPLAVYAFIIKKSAWKGAFLFLFSAALLTSLWLGFNYYCFDFPTTSKTGIDNFWIATNPKYSGFCKEAIMESVRKSKGKGLGYKYKILSKEIKENLARYPKIYLRRVFKVFKHAIFYDSVGFKRLKYFSILTLWFLIILIKKRKLNLLRFSFLLIFITEHTISYAVLCFTGIWVLLRNRHSRRDSGWLVVLFISVLLGTSFFGLDLYTERLSIMTQWTRDIFCLAAFAFIANWVENNDKFLFYASVAESDLCYEDKKKNFFQKSSPVNSQTICERTSLLASTPTNDTNKRFLFVKIVFLLMFVWACAGFALLARSAVKFRKKTDLMKEFKVKYANPKPEDRYKVWEKKSKLLVGVTGEYYEKVVAENHLLNKLFKKRRRFERRISHFPELYEWYIKKIKSGDTPEVVVGNVDFDMLNLGVGEGYKVDPYIFGAEPFPRTIFYMIVSFLNFGPNHSVQKILPIEGYEKKIWRGDYRIVVDGGIKEDIRRKKIIVFGKRLVSGERHFFWQNDKFDAKFILACDFDLKKGLLNLKRVR